MISFGAFDLIGINNKYMLIWKGGYWGTGFTMVLEEAENAFNVIHNCTGRLAASKTHFICRFRTGVTDLRTDGPTDGRTDGRTDRPSYRDARTHLKIPLNWFFFYEGEKMPISALSSLTDSYLIFRCVLASL